MIRAYAVEDIRTAERHALADLPEGELMDRASRGLAEVAGARLADHDGATVVGLVGAGANGGDTLHALAHLAEEGYAAAAVLLPGSGRDGVHAAGLAAAEEAGVVVHVAAEDADASEHAVGEADVVLDGIVGIGGRPGLRPEAARLVDAVDDDAWVLAVDVASGLDPDGGLAVGTAPDDGGAHARDDEADDNADADDAVWADETVTFGAPKPAQLLPAGEAASGRLTVVDIGLDLSRARPAVERLTHADVARLWPVPGRGDDKYSRGVLGVVAGGEAYTGAAVLCTTAAVECGVGMVRYVGTPTPTALVRQAVPEAVTGAGRVQAWVVGPGLDATSGDADAHAEAQLAVARQALAGDLPVLVDAGGLDLVDGPRDAPTLLTPHAGELARLLGRLEGVEVGVGTVRADPLGHARRLAAATGATVLLKGATTLVVTAGRPVRSQADAPPWLATAGAGDVLSGIAGTLLACGLAPHDAAALGALVHGVTADRVSGGGPLRALAVAHGVRAVVRDLILRGRSAPE